MPKQLIYLASPYSHPDAQIRELRYRSACYSAAILMQRDYLVFSPIAHSHPIAMCAELPTDFEYWSSFDERLLSACDILAILTIEGWQSSRGIRSEIEIAKRQNKPVWYLSPDCEWIDELIKNEAL